MGWWGALCTGSANEGLIGQLPVEFLIGTVLSWCALTSFVVGIVATLILEIAYTDLIEQLMS